MSNPYYGRGLGRSRPKTFEERLRASGLRRSTTEEDVRELQWDLERMRKQKPLRRKYPKGGGYWMLT